MDAKDCREYARRCIEMANSSPDARQSTLFELAAAWNRLAAELDDNEVLRDQMEGIKVFPNVGD